MPSERTYTASEIAARLQLPVAAPIVAEPVRIEASPGRTLLRVTEVADRLGIARTTVYQIIGRGELPAIKLGRLTRIPTTALDAFVDAKVREASGGVQ